MESCLLCVVCVLLVQESFSASLPSPYTTLKTRLGSLKGHRISLSLRGHMDVFLGIPYAQPPTGSQRFAHPVPARGWKGVYDATFYRPACPQKLWFLQSYSFGDDFRDTDEDCLYLNVFSPKLDQSDALRPVMVFIHGGAFTYGSGAEYDGRLLALKGVVYVSINYRTGVMGFLSTGDKFAPGNQCQLDQIEALRWVQANIRDYGGDPNKVTIFGQSSGGASVSSHLFSPLAKGLFQGVIAHSGVALSPFAFIRPPYKALDMARDLGSQNGCHNGTTEQLVTCLSSKDIDDLIYTSVSRPPMSSAFVPIVDGYYIHDLPEVLLEKGQVLDVSLMTGTVPDETADELEGVTGIENGISQARIGGMVDRYCSRFGNGSDVVYKALHCEYSLDNTDPTINRENLIAFESDYGYHAPHIKLIDSYHKLQNNSFFYSFEYLSSNHESPNWEGIPHATELFYVFGCPFTDALPCPWKLCKATWCNRKENNQRDRVISDKLMKLWTDFAKYGDPNPRPLPGTGDTWPRYGSEGKYLRVTSSLAVERRYRGRQMHFWNHFLPDLLQGTVSNPCPGPAIVG